MWMTLFCGHHTKTAYFNDCYVWPGREAMGTVGVSIQSELPKGKRWLFNFSLIFPMWGKICIISKSLPWPLCAHTHVAVCVLVISNIFHFFGILTLFTPFTYVSSHLSLLLPHLSCILLPSFSTFVSWEPFSSFYFSSWTYHSLFPSITCPSFVLIQNWIFESFNAVCSSIRFSASPGIYRLLLVTALFLSIYFDFMIAGQCPHVRKHAELCT